MNPWRIFQATCLHGAVVDTWLIDLAYEQVRQPAATTSVLSIRRWQRLRHKFSDKLKATTALMKLARDDNNHVAPAKLAQGGNEDIWSPQAHEVDRNIESMAIFPAQGPNRFVDPGCSLHLGLIIPIILACYVHTKSICIQTVQWRHIYIPKYAREVVVHLWKPS
jgi:hypothetical protein